jgi:hypothetical protein
MSKKVNWVEVDKRIRNRRTDWTDAERAALEEKLLKLPDQAENAQSIAIAQPALAQPEEEEEAEAEAPADALN